MSRRKKNGAKKPPLSFLDKLIYIVLIALGVIGTTIIVILMQAVTEDGLSRSYPGTIACNNYAVVFCAVPLIMLVALALCALAVLGLEKKQPIFGNKKYKPDIMKPSMRVYPLFSKEFPETLSEGTKRKIKKLSVAFSVAFVIFTIVLLLGIYPRHTIDKNNVLASYNSFNVQTHTCSISDADKLEISIVRNSGGKYHSTSFGIELIFEDNGHKYIYNLGSFGDKSEKEKLEYMLYLKSLVAKERYELNNTYYMDEFINYRDYGRGERSLLYELFDCEEG